MHTVGLKTGRGVMAVPLNSFEPEFCDIVGPDRNQDSLMELSFNASLVPRRNGYSTFGGGTARLSLSFEKVLSKTRSSFSVAPLMA